MSIAKKATSILKRDAFLYAAKLFASVIIARKLGSEALGIYIILQMIPSYAELFARMKFEIAAVYFLGKKKYLIGDVVWTLNILALASSVLIVCLVLWQFDWFYSLLFAKTEYDATTLMYFVLLQVPVQFLFMNYSYLIIHRENIDLYNRMIIIQALVSSLVPAVLLLLMDDVGLWVLAFSMLVGTILSLVVGVNGLGYTSSCARWVNLALIVDLFKFGFKLYIASLLGYFQTYVTNLLAVLYLPPSEVAFLSIARNFGHVIERVPAALNTILFPRLTKISDPSEAALMSAQAFRLLIIIMIIVGFIASLIINPLVRMLYGAEFTPLGSSFMILIPGIVLMGASTPIMQYFISINRADLGIALPVIPLIFQVSLSMIFIPIFGGEGAALSLTISSTLFFFISAIFFIHLTDCTIGRHLFLQRKDYTYLKKYIRAEIFKI